MSRSMESRLAALEARYRPTPFDPLTAHALERMTMAELIELEALLLGVDGVGDLPDEPRARVMAMIDAASLRTHPAPLARDHPGYDVMAETRRSYTRT